MAANNCGLFFASVSANCSTMKKISSVLIAAFFSTALFAQDAKIGIKAGLNIASTTNSEGDQSDNKAGLNAGLLAHIHLTPEWAIQPEIVYSSQGAKYTTSQAEHQLNLNYINVPVQLQYNFDNGFRIQTGPQVGLLINANDKVNGNETGIFTSDDFKKTDFSWTFGLGYLTYSGLGLDARYNLGISNINDFGTAKVKNNVFQVGLFYLLDHNHKAKSK
jgi:hypothetical protein